MTDWTTLQEAGAVGLLLVPVYATVKDALRPMRFQTERSKEYLAVFASGVLLHILTEATTLNQRNWLSVSNKDVAPDPRAGDSRVCPLALWCSQPAARG